VCSDDGTISMNKRENATEWESQSNGCYNYVCVNESGGKYELKDNTSEWESQSNECYEYVCDNETGEAKSGKREDATKWENRNNECYEYQCHNESGLIYWKQCNDTDKIERVCENDQCIEIDPKKEEEEFIVEIEVKEIDLTNLNMTEIRTTISDLTSIDINKLRIRVDLNENDEVVHILVIVDDKRTADNIKDKVNVAINEEHPNSIVRHFKGVRVKELQLSSGIIIEEGVILMIAIIAIMIFIINNH
jgi:hypothetical protein